MVRVLPTRLRPDQRHNSSPWRCYLGRGISRSRGRFTVSITDTTTGQSFSIPSSVKRAQQSSAEWIAEAPSSGGILPLANFGTVHFGTDSTGVANTNFATISGTTGAFNSFGANVHQITMVTSGGATKASPSNPSADGTSFSVTWVSSSP